MEARRPIMAITANRSRGLKPFIVFFMIYVVAWLRVVNDGLAIQSRSIDQNRCHHMTALMQAFLRGFVSLFNSGLSCVYSQRVIFVSVVWISHSTNKGDHSDFFEGSYVWRKVIVCDLRTFRRRLFLSRFHHCTVPGLPFPVADCLPYSFTFQ